MFVDLASECLCAVLASIMEMPLSGGDELRVCQKFIMKCPVDAGLLIRNRICRVSVSNDSG